MNQMENDNQGIQIKPLGCNPCEIPWRQYCPTSAGCGIWFQCKRSCP